MIKCIFNTLLIIVGCCLSLQAFSQNKNTIDSLNDVSFEVRVNDKNKSTMLAKRALVLSQQLDYNQGLYRAKLNLGIAFISSGNLDSAYYHLSGAELYFSKKENGYYGLILYHLARLYDKLGEPDRSEAYYLNAYTVFETEANGIYQAYVMNGLGILNGKRSDYINALKYFTKAYELKIALGETDVDKELTNVAIVYRYMKAYDEAVLFGKKALKIGFANSDTTSIINSYDTIGDIMQDAQRLDSAKHYYAMAYDLALKAGDRLRIQELASEQAILLRKEGRFDKAIAILKPLINIPDISRELLLSTYSVLADVYLDLNQSDSAIYYARRLNEEAFKSGANQKILLSNWQLREAYILKGDYRSAVKYGNLYKAYRDTLEQQNREELFSDSRVKLETADQRRQIALLEKQTKIDALTKGRLIIIIVAVSVFSVLLISFVFFWYRHRQKISQLENQKLKADIERSERDLYQQTLHMVHLNNSYNDVEKELKKMKVADGDLEINRLFNKINIGKLLEKDWENFNKYFGNVNKDFHDKLDETNDKLTQHEKRICALIKVNLTNREIATILNIEPKSAKMAKYRIKKKLKLDEQVELQEFLLKL